MNAYLELVEQAIAQSEASKGPTGDAFRNFARAIGRQLRPPYRTRYAPELVADQLEELWAFVSGPHASAPRVQVAVQGLVATITTRMPDQPFIVDTVRLCIRRAGLSYSAGFNAVLSIHRDAAGAIDRVDTQSDPLESIVRISVEGHGPESFAGFGESVERSLLLAQYLVRDFSALTELVDAAAYSFTRQADRLPEQSDRLSETANFLRWLLGDNFVFMGAVYEAHGDEPARHLGTAKPEVAFAWSSEWVDTFAAPTVEFPVCVRKGAKESPVHRAGRVDEILVLVPMDDGSAHRRLYLQGLFTYRAVTQPSRHVPVLRKVLSSILAVEESKPGSYRYKGVANVFDSLPTEFLFTADKTTVTEMIDRVLEAELEQAVRTHVVQSDAGETTFVLTAMPRERWSDRLRMQIQAMLVAETGATYTDHGVFVGRYQTMLVHFFLTGTRPLGPDAAELLHQRVIERTTPWRERVGESLTRKHGPDKAQALLRKYDRAFEPIYMQMTQPDRTVRDIELLERLPATGPGVLADVYRDRKDRVSLRLYQAVDIILSDVLPVLDNFGLIINDQFSDPVRPAAGPVRDIDTFRLLGVAGGTADDIVQHRDLLTDAVTAVFDRRMPDDGLNRVVLRAQIPWQAVDLMRAYLGYARQLGLPYPGSVIQNILLQQPALVRCLWAFFQARFDPDLEGSRKRAVEAARDELLEALRGVDEHDQDVTFRTLYNSMDATLRTNFYRDDRLGYSVSFKVDCARVTQMPSPRLQYEIYVHSTDVEGVHLRGGKIARGGIRWSDRSDYRREILDLVTTQMVKNVLIVPEGAKGGFFMKQVYDSYPTARRMADELYKVFIRGLLDLTDNIVDGEVVSPPRVIAHDDPDPYLVVAADKGTAHLSDTANGLSESYGFWLGDGFASGGSNGYDHKEVGITARGGWVLVRRLMAELGIDPHKDTFTCVGIGDPSGDVFGNGVIEHERMKLLGAFNHLHIFIDPDPDPRTSFEERKRLFDAVKGWDQYDTSKISAGGGIFSRRAKSIALSPEMQKMLGVVQNELPTDAVIRLLLRKDVDLLWNGGIGTYFKASHENHAQANDPTNDALRVNANELRCRIVGEGGNLGFTQAARIEFALGGGRINTDAIDNSGGVDMSDHEVNLKILLNPLVRAGRMTFEERNTLLRSLTSEVADDVLANNDLHGRQLSLDWVRSQRDPMAFAPAIDWACRRSGRTRQELALPSDDELARRVNHGDGLTRPELAVVSAHIKMHVFKDLMADPKIDIPGLHDKVLAYFPERIATDFADDISGHMLHRSIGMTVVVNETISNSGAVYYPMLTELTGASIGQAAEAWYHAMSLIDSEQILKALRKSDASQDARYQVWTALTDAVMDLACLWLAPGEPGPKSEPLEAIGQALATLGRTRATGLEGRIDARARGHLKRGVPQQIAHRVALLGELPVAREIARIHSDRDRLSSTVARYLAVGEASRLLQVIEALGSRRAAGGWEPVAVGILRNRYSLALRALVEALPLTGEVRQGVDRVATRLGREQLKALQSGMDRLMTPRPSLAALLVAEERVRASVSELVRAEA